MFATKILVASAMAAGSMALAPQAASAAHLRIGIGIPAPVVYCAPAPVVTYTPAPVVAYTVPAPVCTAPVVVAPAPVVIYDHPGFRFDWNFFHRDFRHRR